MRQRQQRQRNINRAADTGSDLGKRHPQHTITHRQERYIPRTTPPMRIEMRYGKIGHPRRLYRKV